MIFIDTNILANAYLDQGVKGEAARGFLDKIARGQPACVSALVLDELMWVLAKNGKAHLVRRSIESLYELPNMEILEVSPSAPMAALFFMEKYGLHPRDAFHAASMKENNISKIVSDDAHFDKVKEFKRIPL